MTEQDEAVALLREALEGLANADGCWCDWLWEREPPRGGHSPECQRVCAAIARVIRLATPPPAAPPGIDPANSAALLVPSVDLLTEAYRSAFWAAIPVSQAYQRAEKMHAYLVAALATPPPDYCPGGPGHDPNTGPGSDWCPMCGRYAPPPAAPPLDVERLRRTHRAVYSGNNDDLTVRQLRAMMAEQDSEPTGADSRQVLIDAETQALIDSWEEASSEGGELDIDQLQQDGAQE